eukprot:1786056-Prymnesium_polylepis.2
MAPDGMGRYGSFTASSSRSYQSLIVCVKPHMSGPARNMAQIPLIVSTPTSPHVPYGASPNMFHTAW